MRATLVWAWGRIADGYVLAALSKNYNISECGSDRLVNGPRREPLRHLWER